jgi:hypothetical protein
LNTRGATIARNRTPSILFLLLDFNKEGIGRRCRKGESVEFIGFNMAGPN